MLAIAIRYIIMAAVQLGIWTLLEKYGIPLLNAAIEETMVTFGVSRETAQDIVANKVLVAFEEVGVFAASLKTKMPVKVAEALGFTSKGFVKRALSTKVAEQVEKTAINATSKAVTSSDEVAKIASVVSKTRLLSLGSVKSLLGIIATLIGIPTAFFFALAQYIDFANWQGPYQKTFQGLLAKIGINPDSPMPKARVISTDIWNRIAATVEELGPIGLSFPFSGVDKPYSRLNLADLVDEVAANLVKNGGTASYKNVIGIVLPLVQLGGQPVPTSTAFPTGGAGGSGGTSTGVKVFTGIVSNGVLGAGLSFTPRQDDLIESMAELQAAIDNNLAPFLVTLPGKIVYEIKVVSSIITSDGLKRFGKTQTIQSGTDGLGKPKYKTLVNKWAVLYLYIVTDKGSRSKITSIVLGPTDAVRFRPDNSTLAAVSQVIPTSSVTLNTSDILSVEPSAIKTPTVESFAQAIGVPAERIDQKTGEIINPTPAEVEAYNYQFKNVSTPPVNTPKASDLAKTLFEWYSAQGLTLPTLSDRAKLYQSLGLGQASLYVGTAEQNTKLLNKLKEKPPPPPPVQVAQPAPPVINNTQVSAPSGFFRPPRGTPVYDRSSGASLGLADGNTDYNSAIVRV